MNHMYLYDENQNVEKPKIEENFLYSVKWKHNITASGSF